MHDRLQVREISIVRIGLDEIRFGPLSTLRSVSAPDSCLLTARQLELIAHSPQRAAEQMFLGEKIADAAIDE